MRNKPIRVRAERNRTVLNHKGNLELLILCMPAILLVIIFNYLPMFGIIIAFKDFRYDTGFLNSAWVGFKNFEFFFTSQDAFRITRNTVLLNTCFIIMSLVVSVSLALMLNEIRSRLYIKYYQTTMFFPYFLSWVVAGYMLYAFINMDYGMINGLLENMGMEPVQWYARAQYWPGVLTFMYIWKFSGYYSIIYYAGLMGIDNEYYEAAKIDGASRLQMAGYISIPLLIPLITIMLLLQIGKIFYADFGMFFHLTKDIGALYSTTDVIDTYVYRSLRIMGDVGMSAASGFYQSMVGFILVLLSNYIVKKLNPENAMF